MGEQILPMFCVQSLSGKHKLMSSVASALVLFVLIFICYDIGGYGISRKSAFTNMSMKDQIQLQHSDLKQCQPRAIIIGLRKGGTRALLEFLEAHDNIVTPQREIHYFDKNYENGHDWYISRMPFSVPDQLTIEKTPGYFVIPEVPERIYNFNSSIKLILVMRNPIDRLMSDYLQLMVNAARTKRNISRKSFHYFVLTSNGEVNESYAPIKRSLYCHYIHRWLAFFNLSQILLVDGDKLKTHPWVEMSKVETFLGIPHRLDKSRFVYNETKHFYCVTTPHTRAELEPEMQMTYKTSNFTNWQLKCLVNSKGRKHNRINGELRSKLRTFFEPCNKEFFRSVHHTFDWSN